MLPNSRSMWVAWLALLTTVAGPALAHFSILPPMVGFIAFAAGGLLGLIAVISGIVAKRKGVSRGGALAVVVGALPFLAVAIPGVMSLLAGYPRINDISTDTSDPPAFTRTTVHGDYPDGFADQAKQAYPGVKPLELDVPASRAVALALDVARDRGYEIVATTESGFEGYALSRLFRFRDDFVIRVRPAGGGSVVDMRSASRDGKSDLGVNAARITSFLGDISDRAK